MEFRVLGPLEVVEGDHRYSLGGPKQRAVLAVLIAHAGLPVATGTLINSLYGDEAPERAHRSIHTFISNLRAELGEVIESAGEGYSFVADRSAVDAFEFEDGLTEAESLEDPEAAGAILRRILGLWRGHAYANVDTYDSLSAEISRLDELRVTALSRRIDADLATGKHAGVAAELESLVVDYPMREDFWAQQMVALYRSGRQAEALRWFNKASARLVEETGLDPSPELRDLERRILEHDPSLRYEPRPSIKKAAVLVADVADLLALTNLAPPARDDLVERQDEALAEAVAERGGEVFAHRGSAMYAVFDSVSDAAEAAADTQKQLAGDGESMRIAVGYGDVELRTGGRVVGPPVNRAASLAAAAHGGQILLPADAHQALADGGGAGWVIRSLGSHLFESMPEPIPVYQLGVAGLADSFPPLRLRELPPPIPGTGEGLPGYELRDEVGSGVFGVIHRAYQPSVGREVAVKIIRPEFANHPEFIRRFEVEAQLVARLEHPHIVPMYDYWREPDGAFLVMRWLRGGSLATRLRGGPLTTSDVHSLLEDIVPALDHAHRHGVVHRDLKPSNILFDTDGNAFLTDFGVAKRVDQAGVASIAEDVRGLAVLVSRCLEGSPVSDETSRFLAEADDGRFATLAGLLEAWERVAGEGNAASEEIRFTPTRNPYKGLSAFGELDAADFFGRNTETEQLVAAVAAKRLVAVVGPSGIGKSSVVRAGLLPAIREGAVGGSAEWLIADLMPGSFPFEELASALYRVATEPSIDLEDELRRDQRGLVRAVKRHLPDGAALMLVIDQFEELFTLVDDEEERAAFLELLHAAVSDERSNIRIVLTMRADFFDEPLRFGEFGDLLRESTVPIAAPSDTALRDIITQPAAGVGVAFEPGLVERIAADVKDQPGALPLLEFSLTELFSGRETDEIAIPAYEHSGGVLGALGRRAEEIYGRLNPVGRDATRQVFLRLVNVSDWGENTRRRVRVREFEELAIGPEDLKTVLDEFRGHRLLTFDRDRTTHGPTVEVGHEAILTHWPRLAAWVADLREDLLLHSRLAVAVADWETSGRSDGFLLSSGRLDQHETWSADSQVSLTSGESEFLNLSRSDVDEQRQRRRTVRRRVLAGFAAAAVVAVAFGLVATLQRNEAQQARDAATARELAVRSGLQLDVDAEQGVLLALEAVDLARNAGADLLEVTTALHDALAANRVVRRFDGGSFVAVDTGGEFAVTLGADGGAAIVDIESGAVVQEYGRPDGAAKGASFSPDGSQLAVLYAASTTPLWIWDLSTDAALRLEGQDLSTLQPHISVSFSDSGELVTAWMNDWVGVWSTEDGELVQRLPGEGEPSFIPGTDSVIMGVVTTSTLLVFDGTTGDELSSITMPRPVFLSPVKGSPDGRAAVVAHNNDLTVAAYSLADGAELWQATVDRPDGVAWSSDGTMVAAGSDGGRITLLDGETGAEVQVLKGGHTGGVWEMAMVPGQGMLVTAGIVDGDTIVWNLEPGPTGEVARFDSGARQARVVRHLGTDGMAFVSEHGDPNTALVVDIASGSILLDVADPVVGVTHGVETHSTANRQWLVVATTDGLSQVIDPSTLEPVYTAQPGSAVVDVAADGELLLVRPVSGGAPIDEPNWAVDTSSGERVAELGGGDLVFPFFSSDDRWVYDWNGRVFDVADGRLAVELPGFMVQPMPDGDTVSVIDKSDGTLMHVNLDALLAGTSPAEAALWSAFAGDGLVVPSGHVSNGDGSLVAVATRDEAPVRFWDAATGEQIAEINSGLVTSVPDIYFHPDGSHVSLASEGGIL
ncbi:MAG: BTAD domain-containing putative transcriptional regulator, partial [Acidimicrobiia bacterium]